MANAQKAADAQPLLFRRTYDVADLVVPIAPLNISSVLQDAAVSGHKVASPPAQRDTSATLDYATLIDLIETTIEPDSWDSVGGPGSMAPFESNLSLIVSQTDEGHQQVAALLQRLRGLQRATIQLSLAKVEVHQATVAKMGLRSKRISALTGADRARLLDSLAKDPHSREYGEVVANLFDGQTVVIGSSPPRADGKQAPIHMTGIRNGRRIDLNIASPDSPADTIAIGVHEGDSLLVRTNHDKENARYEYQLITVEVPPEATDPSRSESMQDQGTSVLGIAVEPDAP